MSGAESHDDEPVVLLKQISGKDHLSTAQMVAQQSAGGEDVFKPEEEDSDEGKGELVRGFTTAHRDLKADDRDTQLARMVVTALKSQGWDDVDPDEVEVRDCSGQGGSQTYKISAPAGTSPPIVALHSRSEAVTKDELSEPITEAAAITFGKAGLTPPRLAYGADWFIELWEGTGEPEHDAPDLPQQLGEKLAALHSVDTSWFDEWVRSDPTAPRFPGPMSPLNPALLSSSARSFATSTISCGPRRRGLISGGSLTVRMT